MWLTKRLSESREKLPHSASINSQPEKSRLPSNTPHSTTGENCALVTFFRSNPSGLKDHHNWLTGGDDLHEILALVTATEEYGRQNGCHRQTGVGRRGWLRFFEGYKE